MPPEADKMFWKGWLWFSVNPCSISQPLASVTWGQRSPDLTVIPSCSDVDMVRNVDLGVKMEATFLGYCKMPHKIQ